MTRVFHAGQGSALVAVYPKEHVMAAPVTNLTGTTRARLAARTGTELALVAATVARLVSHQAGRHGS